MEKILSKAEVRQMTEHNSITLSIKISLSQGATLIFRELADGNTGVTVEAGKAGKVHYHSNLKISFNKILNTFKQVIP